MALDPIKISAYDELDETPAIGDLFVIVDISEGADIDKTKHVTMANLVNLADQAAIQEIVSSQAAGDLFYASAATVLARLAKGAGGQILKMNAGATAPEWGGALLDWGQDNGANSWTSGAVAAWRDVTGTTLTLTLPVAGVVIAACSCRFYSNGGWNAFVGINIDGNAPTQILNNITTVCGTPIEIRACAAGNIVVKLQAYAYSTDTMKVEYPHLIAFAIAGS